MHPYTRLFNPDDGSRYRMPVVFGPCNGPRSDNHGQPFDWSNSSRESVAVSFLSEARALERLLPPRFALEGEPIVTVEWTELRNLPWLAGRGYRMLGVKFNCRYDGNREQVRGSFLSVLWENRPEPIMTGREELGFAKVYCELPDPVTGPAGQVHVAAWEGHEFLRIRTADFGAPVDPPASPAAGMLHYRYLPQVESRAGPPIAQAVLTPPGGFEKHDVVHRVGQGQVEFVRSTWQQLPMLHHIVNTLADLPMLAWRGAVNTSFRGAKDLSDQRIID